MIDPARPEVYRSCGQMQFGRNQSVMITGDHKNTAMAIARRLGITRGRPCITGAELEKLARRIKRT